jgi:uncharacterized SAM-binding protein YcdF (DUF218 family)
VLLRILVRLSIAYAIALALILHTPVVDWFAYGLLTAPESPRGDAIVVLSAWATAAGELNESGLRRTLAAASAFRAGAAPRIVVTGSRPAAGHEEGDALQASVRLLRELGVPQDAIAVDDQAENTRASAINIARMAREQRWSGVVLVTDATHMRRARMAFAHEGVSVSSVPTMTWMIGGEKPSIRLAKLGAVLHEYVGLAYYRARGWV